MARRAVSAIGAALALAACASAPPPVSLADGWPRPAPYADTVRAWTRSGRLVKDFDLVLDVHATFLSPAWRSAYVAERAKRERMGSAAHEALEAEERARADEAYEVELLVSTHDADENDLHKGERSMWRIALIDAEGHEIRPQSVERDRRQRATIRAYFPELDDFHTAYRVVFPRQQALLGETSRGFELSLASARGAVVLAWRE
jgi:hypothetical protein